MLNFITAAIAAKNAFGGGGGGKGGDAGPQKTEPFILPKAETSSVDPAVELAARGLLGTYFGSPTQPGMISRPIPIPIRQIAGLSPLEIEARNLAGGLGGFAPQMNLAQQYYMQSGMGYNPMMAQSFMNPYMSSVYQPQMQEIQRLGDQQKREARAQQARSGAFGGSRGAVQEAEIGRNVLDKQAQYGSDLAYKGYTDSLNRSMQGFEDMQRRRAGAAAGISGLGRQGFDMLSSQIGLLGGLGQTGRGIQDRGFGSQYDAALEMANEPYLRFQRGIASLGALAPFLPSYSSGFGTQTQQSTAYTQPSRLDRFLGGLGSIRQFIGGLTGQSGQNV